MIKASRYALFSGAPKNSPAHLETGAKLLLWSEKRTSIRDRVSDPVWNGSTETTLKGMPPPPSVTMATAAFLGQEKMMRQTGTTTINIPLTQ